MSEVKIIPLGGMGSVTQNMFVYEYADEMCIIDCGIGFPDMQMLGVDVILPDIAYLLQQIEQGKKIVGMIFTHGHDDHIAATGYLLPKLPDFPLYASALTAGFAENRMRDMGVNRQVTVVAPREKITLSNNFAFELVRVTHSVPDTRHVALSTPEGLFYHGSDFKFDESPVDGQKSDYETMQRLGTEGVQCALVDCLRVEREEPVASESSVGSVLSTDMEGVTGKILVTLMSSHIHRIQQVVDAAAKLQRKIVFIGRSVEQNVEVALRLGNLHIPKGMLVEKRNLDHYKDAELCLVIAGSQGQEGSSLVRAVFGEHREVSINPADKVLFSADAIPGNEIPYYKAIDELMKNGVEVVYPDIQSGIHQSGHASAPEQARLIEYLRPEYVMPIGGAERHRVLFKRRVAPAAQIPAQRVLLPETGEVVAFGNGRQHIAGTVSIQPQTVDGLGVGDVGPLVIADRKALSESGMVLIVIPRTGKQLELRKMQVVSRGFVFMKEADEVVEYIKQRVAEIVSSLGKKAKDAEVRKAIEKRLGRSLYKIIKREPVILSVIIDS